MMSLTGQMMMIREGPEQPSATSDLNSNSNATSELNLNSVNYIVINTIKLQLEMYPIS